jgi:hypothetical protein
VPALIAVGFRGSTWCRGNAWWSTSIDLSFYLPPYVIGAVVAFGGACYLLAVAAGARVRVARGVTIGALLVAAPAIWFLAAFEALTECPP